MRLAAINLPTTPEKAYNLLCVVHPVKRAHHSHPWLLDLSTATNPYSDPTRFHNSADASEDSTSWLKSLEEHNLLFCVRVRPGLPSKYHAILLKRTRSMARVFYMLVGARIWLSRARAKFYRGTFVPLTPASRLTQCSAHKRAQFALVVQRERTRRTQARLTVIMHPKFAIIRYTIAGRPEGVCRTTLATRAPR
jgi:hypothetical protein